MFRVDVPFERASQVIERGYVSVEVKNPHSETEINEQLIEFAFTEFLVQEREYADPLTYTFGRPRSLPDDDIDIYMEGSNDD